jgi:hypothetical protein
MKIIENTQTYESLWNGSYFVLYGNLWLKTDKCAYNLNTLEWASVAPCAEVRKVEPMIYDSGEKLGDLPVGTFYTLDGEEFLKTDEDGYVDLKKGTEHKISNPKCMVKRKHNVKVYY